MTALFIGIALLGIYLGYVIAVDGKVPPSISDSFYTSGKWWFTLVMFAESILLAISLIGVTPSPWQFLAFLSCAGLGFVGSAPHCHDKYEKKVHYAGAFTFAIGSQLWYWIVPLPCDKPFLVWVFAITWALAVGLCFCFKKNVTFIAEIACIITIIFGRSALCYIN